MTETSSTARAKAASFALEGRLNPLSLCTNCSDAARISSSAAGGSKLKRVFMLLHMFIRALCAFAALESTRINVSRAAHCQPARKEAVLRRKVAERAGFEPALGNYPK